MFQEVLLKHKIWKSKYYRPKYENFLFFSKIQNNVNTIHLHCSSFIEILDMIITGSNKA